MKRPELYHKTVSILVDAYFKDTLVHGICTACAVGNIVAANMGIGFEYSEMMKKDVRWSKFLPEWDAVFITFDGDKIQRQSPFFYTGEAKRQIDAAGYTWQELAKIENAFETAPKGNSDEDWMFNGLMSVVEALDIIHKNNDSQITSDTKKKFNKQLA